MAFGTRIKKVAFAQATGVPQTFVENGEALTYVPPQRDVEGTGFYMPAVEPPLSTGGGGAELAPPVFTPSPIDRTGYWSHTMSDGKKDVLNYPGLESSPPTQTPGWNWTLSPVPKVPEVMVYPIAPRMPTEPPPTLIGPDKFTGPPPPEVQRYDRLPDTPPPGPAVPPQEPMMEALWRQAQETFMGPPQEPGPSFQPTRAFADAEPGAVATAGFDIQKLLLPVGLLAGAFLLMRARR